MFCVIQNDRGFTLIYSTGCVFWWSLLFSFHSYPYWIGVCGCVSFFFFLSISPFRPFLLVRFSAFYFILVLLNFFLTAGIFVFFHIQHIVLLFSCWELFSCSNFFYFFNHYRTSLVVIKNLLSLLFSFFFFLFSFFFLPSHVITSYKTNVPHEKYFCLLIVPLFTL